MTNKREPWLRSRNRTILLTLISFDPGSHAHCGVRVRGRTGPHRAPRDRPENRAFRGCLVTQATKAFKVSPAYQVTPASRAYRVHLDRRGSSGLVLRRIGVIQYENLRGVYLWGESTFTVMGSGFEPGDVIYGEVLTGDHSIPVMGGIANQAGAFLVSSSFDPSGIAALRRDFYSLRVKDTSGNVATLPLRICDFYDLCAEAQYYDSQYYLDNNLPIP